LKKDRILLSRTELRMFLSEYVSIAEAILKANGLEYFWQFGKFQ